MRNKYVEELKVVDDKITEMGLLCEKGIEMAIAFLDDDNASLVKQIRETEEEIDQFEKVIENQCLKLFIREQPVASDLRVVSAAMKMVSDMERIGDHAVDICDVGKYINKGEVKSIKEIKEMAQASSLMVNNVVKAFVKKDLKLAEDVMKYDDVVDRFFDSIKKDIANDIYEKKESAEQGLDCLMVAKYLERIGDHAVNIAEWVVYSITGER